MMLYAPSHVEAAFLELLLFLMKREKYPGVFIPSMANMNQVSNTKWMYYNRDQSIIHMKRAKKDNQESFINQK